MANQRIFQVQALTTNTIAVGGVSTLGFNASYRDIIASQMDGAIGVEDVDRAGLRVPVALQCSDVAKVNSILASTPGETTFYGKESGAATYHLYTIAAASGMIVWSGMNLTLAKNRDGVLRCNGLVRFATGAKVLADVLGLTEAQAEPSKTSPVGLYRPHTASFTPDGGEAITPLHTESVSLSVDANMIEDYGDTDVSEAAVDLLGWNPLQVTLVHRDAVAVSPGEIAAEFTAAAKGVLTVQLLGRGGAAAQVLTVNNLQWTGVDHVHGPEYTTYTMTGVAGWTKRAVEDVNYTMATLFTIAVP